MPGCKSKFKIYHVNLLKKWHAPAARTHRVLAIIEENHEQEFSQGIKLSRDGFSSTVAQQLLLDDTLDRYKEVQGSDPGRTEQA